jgi:hypothetical protein
MIKEVRDLTLRSILFSITNLAGSTSAHLASKSQMAYALQCVEPRLFNWSAGFLRNVKDQITKCRTGKHKQFGYGSFLVSFFLETNTSDAATDCVDGTTGGEPRMERWTSLSPRLGTDSEFKFTTDFFAWLRRQLIVIEDFPYAGVDFWGSLDLVLPEGIDWDASGTKPKPCHVFFFFKNLYYFYVYTEGFLTDALFHHADRGASRPTEIPTLGHRRDAQIVVEHEVVVGGLREVERNL